MQRIAVIPGSFDPVTLGHLDVIERTCHLFDETHVLVVHNPAKTAMLPFADRVRLLEESIEEAGLNEVAASGGGKIVVASWSVGLLVDYVTEVGAQVLVKGIRSSNDVTYETPMAIVNRNLAGVETMMIVTDPANTHVSSSLVRQVAALAGDVSPYVPPAVIRFLK